VNEEKVINELVQKVINWARQNAQEDLYFGAPYSYCRSALSSGFISESEFDALEKYYGNLWHYRGD